MHRCGVCSVVLCGLLVFAAEGCDTSCDSDGRTFEDGDVWTCPDGCNVCSCDDGTIQSTLVGCEGEPGPAANKLLCSVDGARHGHGDTWSCERCGTCECNDGQVVCASESEGDAAVH